MIVIYPGTALKAKCEPVSEYPEKAVRELQYTLRRVGGLALAANQVGILQRIVVLGSEVFCSGDKVILNPEIIWESVRKVKAEERCLSFPGLHLWVPRSFTIKLQYQDEELRKKTVELNDLAAIVMQHEVDHLNGITFIERISKLKRSFLIQKLKRIRRSKK